MNTYAIVEYAGYEGETVVKTGLTFHEACKALDMYDDDEREEMHVDIARETEDGLSYDY